MRTAIPGFAGTLIGPGDDEYDQHREVWNAMVDRRPAMIARCASAGDVAAAVRHAREAGLEIGVKSGGHSVLGMSVPQDGLMIDLTPMGSVRVDPEARRATVGGGALLRYLDQAAQAHGLATTAGNVSHTGVGGLTLGGGMGWLGRQFGLSCDNVEAYTVVTADGETLRATATDEPDLFWGLRGGGGNFGVVTEFEFRLHPVAGDALVVELSFDIADAQEPMRRWRDLLPNAPRAATLTADAITVAGRSAVAIGFVWVGDPGDAMSYLETMRGIGSPRDESVQPMRYLELQSIGDENHHHGLRRYSTGHYLTELSDAAIDAFLRRGVDVRDEGDVDWARVAVGGLQALRRRHRRDLERGVRLQPPGCGRRVLRRSDLVRAGGGCRAHGSRPRLRVGDRTLLQRRVRQRAGRDRLGGRAARLRRCEARPVGRAEATVRPR